jgi:hypothetical protein
MSAGYSGTPLVRKLGFRPGQRIWQHKMPPSVAQEISNDAPDLQFLEDAEPPIDGAHLFTASRAELAGLLRLLRTTIATDGMIWVSWPKKAASIPTDVTEDVVRELALPLGLVDVKVCAVDGTWSGLKLVIRRELR